MMGSKIVYCSNNECGNPIRFKHAKKIKGKYYCGKCAIEIRKEHREETIRMSGIGEELRELDNKIKNESSKKYRQTKKKEKIVLDREKKRPTSKKRGFKTSNMCMTLAEKQALFRKNIAEGMTYEEADKRVRETQEYLKEFSKTLKEKNMSEEDMNKKFKDKFSELCGYY